MKINTPNFTLSKTQTPICNLNYIKILHQSEGYNYHLIKDKKV